MVHELVKIRPLTPGYPKGSRIAQTKHAVAIWRDAILNGSGLGAAAPPYNTHRLSQPTGACRRPVPHELTGVQNSKLFPQSVVAVPPDSRRLGCCSLGSVIVPTCHGATSSPRSARLAREALGLELADATEGRRLGVLDKRKG